MKSLSENEMLEALKWTQLRLPRSSLMNLWLKVSTVDLPKLTNPICYVDRWPNPKVIAGINYLNCHGVEKFPVFCFFSDAAKEDEAMVEDFLEELGKIMDVKNIGGVEANAIDGNMAELCGKVFEGRLGLDAFTKEWQNNGYWLNEKDRNRFLHMDIQPPDGFKFDTLEISEAELVDSVWPHKFPGSVNLIEHRIRHFPTTCLREITSDGTKLASFELMHDYLGIMNHLYTIPEYRRRGLGTLVEQKQCQEMIKSGYIPVKTVIMGNVDGEKITDACPWWEYFGEVSWIRFGDEKGMSMFQGSTNN